MKPRVLVVSPHQDDFRALVGMLGGLAVPADYANDFRQAWERLREAAYGAILAEADLPDGSWLDLLAMVARWPHPPPVIVTRAHADARTWVEAIEAGAYDLLPQPFHGPEVRRIVAHALGLSGEARAAAG